MSHFYKPTLFLGVLDRLGESCAAMTDINTTGTAQPVRFNASKDREGSSVLVSFFIFVCSEIKPVRAKIHYKASLRRLWHAQGQNRDVVDVSCR